MSTGLRDRFFAAIASVGLKRPLTVIAVIVALTVASVAVLPGLAVSTSRTGLVSDDEPDQRRLLAFYEKFGRPDAPLFVITGGTEEQRRQTVDALEGALEADPRFEGRVLGHVTLSDVAPILLLQQQAARGSAGAALPEDIELDALIEGGAPAWFGALEDGIVAGLEGRSDANVSIEQGLDQVGQLADAFSTYLDGGDPLRALQTSQVALQPGLDPHGYLIADEGQAHLVAVYAQMQTDEGRDLVPLIEDLRAIRDATLADAPDDVRADLTGLPALSVDELEAVNRGLLVSSIAATAGIFGLCLVLFRSLRQTIIALIPLLPGTVCTLAVVRLTYGELNLITSSFVAVLLGLGIDFAVHIVARSTEEVRLGRAVDDAVRTALMRTGPGIMTGTAITACAFLATTTTEFTAYGELGVITAIGLLIIMTVTFFLLPPCLWLARGSVGRPKAAPRGFPTLVKIIRRFRIPIVALAVVTMIAGIIARGSIAFDPRYFGFLPQATESARALERLEYDPVTSPIFASLTASSIEEARAMAQELREEPTVASVQSPSDLLPPLDPAMIERLRSLTAEAPNFARLAERPAEATALAARVQGIIDALDEVRFALKSAGRPVQPAEDALRRFEQLKAKLEQLDSRQRERLAALHPMVASILEPAWRTAANVAARGHYTPDDIPASFSTRFVARDGSAVALYAVPAGQFWEEEVADAFARDVRAVDPDAAGLALIHVRHGQMIRDGFERATLFAAGAVLVLILLDFQRVFPATLALIPTAMGWLWMVGLMALLRIDFNVANIVSMPLVIGIGIAFGVHMMHRVLETKDGEPPRLEDVVVGTGGAIAVAAFTTIVGFGGLVLTDYGGMRSFGMVMVLGIGTCLLATLCVLPAILLVVRRAR